MTDIISKKLGKKHAEKIFDYLFGDNFNRPLTEQDYKRTLDRIEQGADLNCYLGGDMFLDHAIKRRDLTLAKLFRSYGAKFDGEGIFNNHGQLEINCPSAVLTYSWTTENAEIISWITKQVPSQLLFSFSNEIDTPALIYLAINDCKNLDLVLSNAKIKPQEKELSQLPQEYRDKYINLCKIQALKVFKLAAKYGYRNILSWCIQQGFNITLEQQDARDSGISQFIQLEQERRDQYKAMRSAHFSFPEGSKQPQTLV